VWTEPLKYSQIRTRDSQSCHLAPLGVPTRLIADDPSLLRVVLDLPPGWQTAASIEKPTLTLRLRRGVAPATNVNFSIAVEGSRLAVTGHGICGWADARLGEADCLLESHDAAEIGVAPREVVETLLLFLLTRHGRVPLHASGLLMGNQAILLAGPSGSGKSMLALSAARRGLAVLSDDTVFVQNDTVFRIWGLGGPIHVLPKDARTQTGQVRLRNGSLKLAVTHPGARDQPLYADRASLVLLTNGARPGLVRIGADAVRSRLTKLEPGFDLLREEIAAAVEALLEKCETWQLTLSRDPDEALELLCNHFTAAAGCKWRA